MTEIDVKQLCEAVKGISFDWYAPRSENYLRFEKALETYSNGALQMVQQVHCIVQVKSIQWSILFDILKELNHSIVVDLKEPGKWRIKTPCYGKRGAQMYAHYSKKDGYVHMAASTGRRRDPTVGFDGYGMEPDELEELVGVMDRKGNWVDPLSYQWV